MRNRTWLVASITVVAVGVSGIAYGQGSHHHKAHKQTLRGPRGPRGPRGFTGPQGLPGKDGTFDWSKLAVRQNTVQGFDSSLPYTTVTAACQPGEHVLTGGAEVRGGYLVGSLPMYGSVGTTGKQDGWTVEAVSNGTSSETFQFARAVATCVRP